MPLWNQLQRHCKQKAGKNEANAMPMISAIYAAIDIVRNRRLYEEMRADVLKVANEPEKEGIKGPV